MSFRVFRRVDLLHLSDSRPLSCPLIPFHWVRRSPRGVWRGAKAHAPGGNEVLIRSRLLIYNRAPDLRSCCVSDFEINAFATVQEEKPQLQLLIHLSFSKASREQ